MNKSTCLFGILLFLLACNGISTDEQPTDKTMNKFADATIRKIYDLQNERKSDSLAIFLKHPDARYRGEAALSFASVQDTNMVNSLLPLLLDSSENVREAVAYSLGQTKHSSAEIALIEASKKESSAKVTSVLLESIGKCATSTGVDFLSSFYGKKSTDYGVASGLFRASINGINSENGLKRIIELLQPNQQETTRIIASTYLARNRQQDVSGFTKAITNVLRNDNSEFVRMNCAIALRQAKETDISNNLLDALDLDESQFVKINAIRALASLKVSKADPIVLKYTTSQEANLAIAASEYFMATAHVNNAKLIANNISEPQNWKVKANLYQATLPFLPELKEQVLEALNKTTNPYEQGQLLLALASQPENYEYLRERLYNTQNTVIKSYAIEGLANIRTHLEFNKMLKKEPDLIKRFAQYFKYAIESKDIGLIYHSAILLRNPKLDFKKAYQSLDFLTETMKQLKLPVDIEAYQELERTAIFFRLEVPQQTVEKEEAISTTPIDWNLISTISKDATLTLSTQKGEITWQLLVESAPATVAEIVKLSKNGFYNGKNFHRIVPNFVAQGGCPRGDGFGGLPYSIKSEFAPLSYMQGMVGMASAGKDTESCQWFITHCPTPHLDGRYTIFAKTIYGIKNVQKLEIGDNIQKIRFSNPNL